MMRPRNYGVLNRSIARGVTYALRENDRKKRNAKRNSNFYLNSSVKQNNNNTIDPVANTTANIVIGIIAFCFLAFILSV